MSPEIPNNEEQENSGRTGKKLWPLWVAAVTLVFCLAGFFLYQQLYAGAALLPGVRVGTMELAGLNRDQAEALIHTELQQDLEQPVIFFRDDYQQEVSLGELLVPVDTSTVLEEIWQAESDLGFMDRFDAVFRTNNRDYTLLLVEPDLEQQEALVTEWNQLWGQEKIEPHLQLDQGEVIIRPGQNGLRVDEEMVFASLSDLLGNDEEIQIEIVFIEEVPDNTREDLSSLIELSTFSTKFREHEINRSHNLRLAAEKINGTALQPGETFSFNGVVGQRTWGAGFRTAMVVVGNVFEEELGGGICQVSSTLYNSALLAGLEIVERYNHGISITYVPLGLDATVYYGVQDFKFRNNQDHPVYIGTSSADGTLTIAIYGDESERKNIKLRSIVDSVIGYSQETKVDNSLAPGTQRVSNVGSPGYHARGFQDIYDESGEKLLETITLSNDYYRPSPRVILVGANPDGSVPNGPTNEGAAVANGNDSSTTAPIDGGSGTEPTDDGNTAPNTSTVGENQVGGSVGTDEIPETLPPTSSDDHSSSPGEGSGGAPEGLPTPL